MVFLVPSGCIKVSRGAGRAVGAEEVKNERRVVVVARSAEVDHQGKVRQLGWAVSVTAHGSLNMWRGAERVVVAEVGMNVGR